MQLDCLFAELNQLKSGSEHVAGFLKGTMFEFSIRNDAVANFDRLVTVPCIYSLKQIKVYIQQTLAKEQLQLMKAVQIVPLSQI